VAILERDPDRRIEGRENFRAWMQERAESAISELHGASFDIPEPARRIEAMIAPTNDGGIYYTPPSEDWSRPGRMWWSVPDGLDTFSTWKEVTTIHHEGVPGHHLQVSQAIAGQDTLNRWQRLLCWVPGHGEGWANYAQRLMGELGYLGWPGQAPAYQLGQRIWLQAREEATQRAGGAFSLKDFHSSALALGSMGLDPLREALARL